MKKEDILTPVEQSKVIMFNADPVLKGAIKKILLADIYSKGVMEKGKDFDTTNWSYSMVYNSPDSSDELLGQKLRGVVMGLSFLEDAFKKLESYRSEEEPKEEKNPAR